VESDNGLQQPETPTADLDITGIGGTGGLNIKVLGDRLKVMLGYDYWRRRSSKLSERLSEQELLLRLQAAF